MEAEQKKYILENIGKKSVEQISQELNLKERKVRKFLQKQKTRKRQPEPKKEPLVPIKKGAILLSIALIIILGFVAYSNSLNGDLLWDDHYLVKKNLFIKNLSYLPNIFTENIGSGGKGKFSFYRPLQMLTYMLDYSLWGMDVRGYHLTNILLHILVALGIYWFINMLYSNNLLSLFTSILFVVHPVHTEAVTYISGRADSLAAALMLLCIIFYIKNIRVENRTIYGAMIFSYALALLSREISLFLPALILLYHSAFKVKIKRKLFLPLLSLACLYIVLRVWVFGFMLPHEGCPYTIFQRAPGFLVAITNYVRLLFLPFNLHMEYGLKFFSLSHPKALFGAAILISSITYALRKRNGDSLIFFSIFWFIIALLPSSNLYPINAYMAEHWLYLPSIGFFLLCAKALNCLYGVKKYRPVAILLILGLLAFYSSLTIKQNTYWRNPITLYKRTLKFVFDSAVLHNNLGILYGDKGDIEGALSQFKKAIEIDALYVNAYNNLGKTSSLIGKKEEAIAYYKKAIELYPDSVQTYYNLGNIYNDIGNYQEAIASYSRAIEISPYYAEAYNNLGNAYKRLGNSREAIASYKKSMEIDPDYIFPYNSLGVIYHEMGKNEEAIEQLMQASKISPDHGNTYHYLSIVYFNLKQYKLAIQYFDKATDLGITAPSFSDQLKPFRVKEE